MDKERVTLLKEEALDLSIIKYRLLAEGINRAIFTKNFEVFMNKQQVFLREVNFKKEGPSNIYIFKACGCCAVSYFLTNIHSCGECIIKEGLNDNVVETLEESNISCMKSYYYYYCDDNTMRAKNILKDLLKIEKWYYDKKRKKIKNDKLHIRTTFDQSY